LIPINESDMIIMIRVGQFFTAKWRKRLERVGHVKVLQQMRKQGIPAEIAVAMLCVTPQQKETP
jgi:hypothetical protein